jgi:hypothetical protein
MSQTVYVDPDDLKKTLSASGSDYLDDELENAANAISRGIDRALGRTFGRDSEEVERHYSALDPWSLTIDDLVTLTSLETDEDGDGTFETTWAASDYVLEPLNAPLDSEPYTGIRVHPNGSRRFPTRYPRAVRLTGIFGWPAVPPQISEACWIIAEQLNQRKRTMPMGFTITAEAVAYIVRTDPQLSFLFTGLGRRRLVA